MKIDLQTFSPDFTAETCEILSVLLSQSFFNAQKQSHCLFTGGQRANNRYSLIEWIAANPPTEKKTCLQRSSFRLIDQSWLVSHTHAPARHHSICKMFFFLPIVRNHSHRVKIPSDVISLHTRGLMTAGRSMSLSKPMEKQTETYTSKQVNI